MAAAGDRGGGGELVCEARLVDGLADAGDTRSCSTRRATPITRVAEEARALTGARRNLKPEAVTSLAPGRRLGKRLAEIAARSISSAPSAARQPEDLVSRTGDASERG